MKFFVTGGSGFIGSHIVKQLIDAGHEVRALAHSDSYTNDLRALKVVIVHGSLSDRAALGAGMQGADGVFHVAALYAIAEPKKGAFVEANVEGTKNVLAAARAANVKRVVITSTHATIAAVDNPNDSSDESAVYNLGGRHEEPYVASKWAMETAALESVAQGQDIVIVNPTATFGAGDRKPTPTGKLVIDFMRGRIPGFLPGGFNVAQVRDVARGHILAFEKGRKGQRYILGGENLSMKQLLDLLAVAAKKKQVNFAVPAPLAYALAGLQELGSKLSGKPPMITRAYVMTARRYLYFRLDKARNELGYTTTPIAQALSEAVAWFSSNPRG